MYATPNIVVTAQTAEQSLQAQQLAEQLQLKYLPSDTATGCAWQLILQSEGIVLQFPGARKPFRVDFLQGQHYRRLLHATLQEPLARAFDLKQALKTLHPVKIVDCTAGWGGDAMLLAKLGAAVTAYERSPIVGTLLADGIRRAQQSADFATITLDVHLGDACCLLTRVEPPSLIYLDPMFPASPNSALVKKPLQLLHLLLEPTQDVEALATLALATATQRVVIKRPTWAPALIFEPSYTIPAGIIRFDVYMR